MPPASAHTAALDDCPLFAGLTAADRAAVDALALPRRYQRQETLFHQGQAAAGFHVVVSGQVKICRFGADGRQQILHVMGPGQPCGEVPVFQGLSYPANAVALEDVATLYFCRQDFLDLGARQPAVLLNMIGVLAARLRHFVQLVDDLALKEVGARLARYLLDSAAPAGGNTVLLPTTKAVLASRLGTIAETLSRTLGRLQAEGLISVQGRRVRLHDRVALEALASGLQPPV